jgi:hypothetical protein
VLFPAPPNASGANVVTDAQGRKYYTSQPGNLSGNGQFATTTLTMPAQVVVPETDARGNLLLDGSGRIIIRGSRDFEGGDIEITYQAGATDTSVWETSFQGPGLPAEQRIVLIR